jgi:hypothetical protein
MHAPTQARFLIPFLALLLVSGAATARAHQSPPPTTDSQPPAPVQPPPPAQSEPAVNTQLPVNWLYGAYIPKDVPIFALNGPERFKLYIRQTYTTPGIYIKTGFFALHDQVRDPGGMGGWIPGFHETRRLQSGDEYHPELIYLARSRDRRMGTAL